MAKTVGYGFSEFLVKHRNAVTALQATATTSTKPINPHTAASDENAEGPAADPPVDIPPPSELMDDPVMRVIISSSLAGACSASKTFICMEANVGIVTDNTGRTRARIMFRHEMTPSAIRSVKLPDVVEGTGAVAPPTAPYAAPDPVGFIDTGMLGRGVPKPVGPEAGVPKPVGPEAGVPIPAADPGAEVLGVPDPDTLAPHFGQKDAPGFSSLPHLPQNIFSSQQDVSVI